MSSTESVLDPQRLEELSGKVMSDVSGAMGVMMAYLGDQTGIYKCMERIGSSSIDQIASESGLLPRYVQEFLAANTALGYVTFDADSETYSISPEQAAIFAREGEPTCMQGFFQAVVGQYETYETAVDVFKTGRGRPWGEHSTCCFVGTDRFFRPGYEANLLSTWIPAMEGVQGKLETGGKIADIACGHGSSTILMAKKFPNSVVHGFDFHEPSIESAKAKAELEGLDNIEFFEASAKSLPDNSYDFACIFDALHDMGDPVGAAEHIRTILNDEGTFMLVEPPAGDSLSENMNPLGSIFYSFSTLVCVPTSLAQEVGLGLGAQAGEQRLTKVLKEAGFGRIRRVEEATSNIVLQIQV